VPGETEDVLAVVAHGLLGPVGSIRTAAVTLARTGDILPPEVRTELLQQMTGRCELVSDLLIDLVRGASPDVRAALSELRRDA
jgi:K+-sensing histidine kinase KdpD